MTCVEGWTAIKFYNAKSDLMNNFESYKEIYDLNISHINSNGGEDLSDEEKNILIAGYLGNMHETLSKISSNLCNLSKSDYEAAVYIANISECQRQINEELIKDDIQMFLDYKDITETEKIALIKEYINRLGAWTAMINKGWCEYCYLKDAKHCYECTEKALREEK